MVRRLLVVLPILLLLESCLVAQPKTITILHTNDMHAQYLPKSALWVKSDPQPLVGGFVRLKELVDSIRAVKEMTLLLDGGDVMTGNPITDRVFSGAEGGALLEMMNMIEYDAWAPGNHDLDISQENLRGLVRIARFPTLSANLVNDREEFLVGNTAYAIFERGGLKIGVIGLMSPELYGLVNQNNLVGVRVLSTEETAKKYVRQIDPETDLIILLTHQGVEFDSTLAANISGVDVIVGGHSHTRLRSPRVVNDVLIVQAGSSTENLGELELAVEDDRVVSYKGKLIPTWVTGPPPPSPLTSLVDSMRQEIDREYSEVIGTLRSDWRRSSGQSAIGTYIAEAQRVAGAGEIAFMNDHGIRKDQATGPITKKDLFEILPFRNMLQTFQMSGRQLEGVMRYLLEKKPAVQVAGMTARYIRNKDGTVQLHDVRVQGYPLEPNRMYRCVASDYFIGEARRYIGVVPDQIYPLSQTLFSAVEKAIRHDREIRPKVLYSISEDK